MSFVCAIWGDGKLRVGSLARGAPAAEFDVCFMQIVPVDEQRGDSAWVDAVEWGLQGGGHVDGLGGEARAELD